MKTEARLGDRLLTSAQVAYFFRHTLAWWNRTGRAQLEAIGFPKPLPGHTYDPRAIDAWLTAQLSPELRQVVEGQQHNAEAAGQDEDRAALHDRLRDNAQRVIARARLHRRARKRLS